MTALGSVTVSSQAKKVNVNVRGPDDGRGRERAERRREKGGVGGRGPGLPRSSPAPRLAPPNPARAGWGLARDGRSGQKNIDIPPDNLDSSLCFLQPSVSYDVLCIEVK